jgi:hypothetical protein
MSKYSSWLILFLFVFFSSSAVANDAHAQIYPFQQINSFQKNATMKVHIMYATAISKLNYADITGSKIGCAVVSPDANSLVQISSYNKLISVTDSITAEKSYFECTPVQYETIDRLVNPSSSISTFETWIIWAILWVFSTIISFGILLLRWSAWVLGLMIGQGTFINNELVKEAWPFVQGFANLGFIFALLYIAFATTLRLQSVSTSVQRLLPKLLIGALLVNFSLVIGGLMIDASRLVMAVEINIFGSADGSGTKLTPDNLGVKLLERSNIYNDVFTATSQILYNTDNAAVQVNSAATGSWDSVFKGLQSMIFVWMMAVGLMVVALGLFWRYIMLLLLLIVSPMAYVAIALPQTEKYFRQWWSQFLKWVTYGPVMLFMLIMIVRVQSITITSNPDASSLTKVYTQIIGLVVTVSLLLIAAKLATSSSGAFANSFMGMANKTGAWARKNPKMALTVGSGGLLAPAMLGVSGARRQAGDFISATGENLKNNAAIKRVGKNLGYDKNTKSYGTQAANKMFGGLNADTAKKNEEIANVKKNIKSGSISNKDDDSLLPTMLGKEHVLEALEDGNVNDIVKNGSHSQRMAIVSNKKYMEKVAKDSAKLTKLQKAIKSSYKDPKDAGQKKEAAQAMDRMMQTMEANNKK